jgi:hypothetical protein
MSKPLFIGWRKIRGQTLQMRLLDSAIWRCNPIYSKSRVQHTDNRIGLIVHVNCTCLCRLDHRNGDCYTFQIISSAFLGVSILHWSCALSAFWGRALSWWCIGWKRVILSRENVRCSWFNLVLADFLTVALCLWCIGEQYKKISFTSKSTRMWRARCLLLNCKCLFSHPFKTRHKPRIFV